MEESPSGAGSHKRTRPVEAAGAADAQTRPPRLGKHCAFSPSFHRALPHHKHTQRKTRKSTGHWASWSPFSQFRTHMNFRRAKKHCGPLGVTERRRNDRHPAIDFVHAQVAVQHPASARVRLEGDYSTLGARPMRKLKHVCTNVRSDIYTGRARPNPARQEPGYGWIVVLAQAMAMAGVDSILHTIDGPGDPSAQSRPVECSLVKRT